MSASTVLGKPPTPLSQKGESLKKKKEDSTRKILQENRLLDRKSRRATLKALPLEGKGPITLLPEKIGSEEGGPKYGSAGSHHLTFSRGTEKESLSSTKEKRYVQGQRLGGRGILKRGEMALVF